MEISWALPLGLGLAVCVLIGLAILFSIITRIVERKQRPSYPKRRYYITHNYVGVRELEREIERLRKLPKKKETTNSR